MMRDHTGVPGVVGAAALGSLSRLIGVWEGDGEGHYPTIEPFEYRERVELLIAQPSGFVGWARFSSSQLVDRRAADRATVGLRRAT